MGERLHVLVAEARELVSLDPRPSPDISDRVFALAGAGEVVPRGARVFPRELDLEYAINSQSLIVKAFDCV